MALMARRRRDERGDRTVPKAGSYMWKITSHGLEIRVEANRVVITGERVDGRSGDSVGSPGQRRSDRERVSPPKALPKCPVYPGEII